MAKGKARTDAQKERAKDLRIRSTFGITLADRTRRAQEQNNICPGCGGALDAYGPPHIDHYHFHVEASRHLDTTVMVLDGWEAQGFDEHKRVICVRRANTRAQAIAAVKKAMMPWAIRALLCAKCNRGAGMMERFFDAAHHPENLLPLVNYFRARLNVLDKAPVL